MLRFDEEAKQETAVAGDTLSFPPVLLERRAVSELQGVTIHMATVRLRISL
jgi:hypothetical protein